MRGWTYSSKNPERYPDNKKQKRRIVYKSQKERKKRAALEWGDIDMQAKLKSFMYIDRSLRKKRRVDE